MKLALPAPGFLPTAWALMLLCATVAAMLFIAAGRKKLRSLLATEGTLGWSGGTMILMSGFFVFIGLRISNANTTRAATGGRTPG